MAAVSAARSNQDLKAFYQKLRTQGKPFKVAIIAVMRKLLAIFNRVMQRRTPWQEKNPKFS